MSLVLDQKLLIVNTGARVWREDRGRSSLSKSPRFLLHRSDYRREIWWDEIYILQNRLCWVETWATHTLFLHVFKDDPKLEFQEPIL